MPHDVDLFEEEAQMVRMTFAEHLEDLRLHLLRALFGLIPGVIIGLFVGGWVVRYMSEPAREALASYYEEELETRRREFLEKAQQGGPVPLIQLPGYVDRDSLRRAIRAVLQEDNPAPSNNSPQTPDATKSLMVQEQAVPAGELNQRYVVIPLWVPKVTLETAVTLPELDSAIISLGPYETILAYFKASIIVGIVITSPWIFYQIWSFVAAGLYSHERRVVYRFLPLTTGLFLTGVLFCFFIVLPVILNFLLSFNRWIGIKPQIRLSEWMGFATLLPLMFGISFQLPLVMLALERVGIFTVDDYRNNRKYAVLLIAFLSMMLTPPDPGSMLAMMLPAMLLYEAGIKMCLWYRPVMVPKRGRGAKKSPGTA